MRNYLHHIDLWASRLWGIFFMTDWCVRAQPTAGGLTPEQMKLDRRRRVGKHAMGSKPVSSTPQSLPQFLLQVSP